MRTYKIVTIGGGSSYTPELIEGFIRRYEELPVRELWLVDIEEGREKLEIITALARRMVKKAGVPMKIHATLNRREALKDADFVTTQLRVGGLEARALDESIPLKHGLIGQETNGAGGMFKALRTIPVIFDIITDCRELCPDAWIINFTNPAGLVTEAVLNHSDWDRFIGVCNLPFGMEMGVSKILEVEKDRVRVHMAGLNHMVFGLDVLLDGTSVKEEVLDLMVTQSSALNMKNVMDLPWSPEFLKGLGAIPCAYHRYYFQKEEMLSHMLEDFSRGSSRATEVMEVERTLFEKYKDVNLEDKPEELEKRGGAYYSDTACNLISSIANDKGDIQVVNTRNRGAIASLPYECAVEVSSVITKNGPVPLATGYLPVGAEGIVQQLKSFEKLTCEAALSGKYEDAFVAMVTNPLVQSEKVGRLVLDELLLAHENHLPQFRDVIENLRKNP
ncbi:6-phospho-beta-glucosidase [Proteiniclasticum sp. C24MP]|uniref:6-phospho-beta-glucosidase n=1 Tax=Proteiniclasticum sp. C24MP TaxID=3374101 RepID=UPI0037541867